MAFLINGFQSLSGAYQTGKEVVGHASKARTPASVGAVLGALYGMYTSRGSLTGRASYIMNCAFRGATVMTGLYVAHSMYQAKVSELKDLIQRVDKRLGEKLDAANEGLANVQQGVSDANTSLAGVEKGVNEANANLGTVSSKVDAANAGLMEVGSQVEGLRGDVTQNTQAIRAGVRLLAQMHQGQQQLIGELQDQRRQNTAFILQLPWLLSQAVQQGRNPAAIASSPAWPAPQGPTNP